MGSPIGPKCLAEVQALWQLFRPAQTLLLQCVADIRRRLPLTPMIRSSSRTRAQ